MIINMEDDKNNTKYLLKENINKHVLIIGTSGAGKSNSSMRTTDVSQDDEVLKEKRRLEREAKEIKRNKIDMALKEAYWNNAVTDFKNIDYELSIFVTMAGVLLGKEYNEITEDQAKTVFFAIDRDIFNQGVMYGFSDTEVGYELNKFYETNEKMLKEKLGKV